MLQITVSFFSVSSGEPNFFYCLVLSSEIINVNTTKKAVWTKFLIHHCLFALVQYETVNLYEKTIHQAKYLFS